VYRVEAQQRVDHAVRQGQSVSIGHDCCKAACGGPHREPFEHRRLRVHTDRTHRCRHPLLELPENRQEISARTYPDVDQGNRPLERLKGFDSSVYDAPVKRPQRIVSPAEVPEVDTVAYDTPL
jgi:hypothetical protein